MKGNRFNLVFLIMVLAIGGLLGNLIGSLVGDNLPLLASSQTVGIDPPMYLDLSFFSLKFGFLFDINLAGLIGLGLSIWIFSKL